MESFPSRFLRRTAFSNREIPLADEPRLADYKDNVETRLFLPPRWLEDKGAPIQLVRMGRGRIGLALAGCPLLDDERR